MNCVVNFADMVTDSLTFVYLWNMNQPHWALITLLWMFVPFFLHMNFYLAVKILNLNKWLKYRKGADLVSVLIHLPFVTPIRNLIIFVKLCKLGYPYHKEEYSKEIEALQKDVAQISLYENFGEAGPQCATQCYIFLCTGHISVTQIVSIFVSLFTLTWGASRAYFIQRVEDEADPDPKFSMVIFRIFPFMLVTVINSLVMWVLIGGLLGGCTFVAIVVNFLGVLTVIAPSSSRAYAYSSLFVLIFVNLVTIATLAVIVKIYHDSWLVFCILCLYLTMIIVLAYFAYGISFAPVSFKFSMLASLCSLWVPCVIGSHFHLFLYSVIITLSLKICELAVAFSLAFFGQQWPFYSLIWCAQRKDVVGEIELLSTCSFSDPELPRCFTTDTNNLRHQFRICEENEDLVQLCVFIGIALTNLLAIFSSWELHRRSDYANLYHATKHLLWIFPSEPVIHRSLLFSLVSSDNSKDLEKLLGEKTYLADDVNCHNAEGDTPLHVACQNKSIRWVYCERMIKRIFHY